MADSYRIGKSNHASKPQQSLFPIPETLSPLNKVRTLDNEKRKAFRTLRHIFRELSDGKLYTIRLFAKNMATHGSRT